MDEEVREAITGKLADAAPDYPQCPECGNPFKPGHICAESLAQEITMMRAAFHVAVLSVYKIRNALLVWRRGKETEKLNEVFRMTKKAIADIEELVYSPAEKKHEPDGADIGKPGSVPTVPPDSV